MSFTADWLTLREAADHRARAPFADADLQRYGHVVDLGCGTGSNFRYLAPRLAPVQRWLCIDHDRALLERLAERIGASGDWMVGTRAGVIEASGQCRAAIDILEHDLSGGLPPTPARPDTIVTASALLDLVSGTWLQAAAAWCAARGVPALFALTFDGRMHCEPADPFDTEIYALVNRHQLGDKGFGAALGPGAVEAAITRFTAFGYTSHRARSDWQIAGEESALALALVTGWCDAAAQLAPERRGRIAAWLERRAHELAEGRLALTVGHEDLLFLPRRQ